MYQFTTTNVINSATDSNTAIAKYAGANGVFNVARVGSFKKDKVVSVYKNAYVAGVLEEATITVPTVTLGLVIRATVNVFLTTSANSEYANFSMDFKKPVTVEVISTGDATTDAAALVKQLKALKDRFGYAYITASNSTNVITIKATEPFQRIKSIIIEKEVASPNSMIQPEYQVVGTSFTVTVPGVDGFGDDSWMVRNIVIPTAENVRHFGMNKDGRPIIGGGYDQYTLRYKIELDGDDGVFSGAQSVTTHVFYVLSTLSAAFKTAMENAGITVLTAPSTTGTFAVTVSDITLSILSGDTAQLFPVNFKGVVTYADTAGTGTVTISSSGVITPTVAGDTTITATDTFTVGTTTSTATATVTLKVVA